MLFLDSAHPITCLFSAQRLPGKGCNFLTLTHDKVSLKGQNKITLGGRHWEVLDMTRRDIQDWADGRKPV